MKKYHSTGQVNLQMNGEIIIKRILLFLLIFLSFFFFRSVSAQEQKTEGETKEETKKIQDNSFLLEEAYNQEAGVVQHIQSFQYNYLDKSWFYTFTQEWPVPGETHQLSFTIPVAHLTDDRSDTAIGDILINYRYQLINKGRLAIAPRFSLILPTGDYRKGFGTGSFGYQTDLPISLELSDKFVTHWNAGLTYTPGSREPGGKSANTLGFNYGASIIWLTSENFNVMCEFVGASNEVVVADETGGIGVKKANSFFINPGVRFAINCDSGLQIVPGISFPIGVGPSDGQNGVFIYLSFEHPMFEVSPEESESKK